MNRRILLTLGLLDALSLAAVPFPALGQTAHIGEHVTFIATSGYTKGGCLWFQTEEAGGQLGVNVSGIPYYAIGFGSTSTYAPNVGAVTLMISTSRYSLRTQTLDFTELGLNTNLQYYSDCKDFHTAVAGFGQ